MREAQLLIPRNNSFRVLIVAGIARGLYGRQIARGGIGMSQDKEGDYCLGSGRARERERDRKTHPPGDPLREDLFPIQSFFTFEVLVCDVFFS